MAKITTAQLEAQAESARAEALAKARVAQAYKDVFGADEKRRSKAQQIVWEDMQKACSMKMPVFTADAAGALCPIRGAHVDGRRWVWLYVDANVTTEVKIPD